MEYAGLDFNQACCFAIHVRQRKGVKNMENMYLRVEDLCKRMTLMIGQRVKGRW